MTGSPARRTAPARLPADSLLRLAPVRHALEDPGFALVARPVDQEWHYAGATGVMGGYAPLSHTHYYARTAVLHRWLEEPARPARALNAEDRLVREVLHMTHDHLHSWAYRMLADLDPASRIGERALDRENLETYALLHLVTEAAAVVGLDYWYLSVADVNERCDLGSLVGPRTIEYRERNLAEYRRFHPALEVQTPGFFRSVVRLFAHDEIEGFVAEDLDASPMLARWLTRELLAARSQRFVTRLWLARLAGIELDDEALRAPLPPMTGHLAEVCDELGRRLWRKIKADEPQHPRRTAATSWRGWAYPARPTVDFRLTNVGRVRAGRPSRRSRLGRASFAHWVDQRVSRRVFPRAEPEVQARALRELRAIKQDGDARRLERLLTELPEVPGQRDDPGPLELIFLN